MLPLNVPAVNVFELGLYSKLSSCSTPLFPVPVPSWNNNLKLAFSALFSVT
jgi:hypothetical protein